MTAQPKHIDKSRFKPNRAERRSALQKPIIATKLPSDPDVDRLNNLERLSLDRNRNKSLPLPEEDGHKIMSAQKSYRKTRKAISVLRTLTRR